MNTGQYLKIPVPLILMILPGILLTGIITGIYPAIVMSSRNIVRILKKQSLGGHRGISLRYALIFFQFSVSMIMIASTLIINRQLMFIRNFLIILGISWLIACPVTWYFMHNWLERFAYRTGTGIWIYLASGLIVALSTLSVAGWQSWKYAKRNPVEALRYE